MTYTGHLSATDMGSTKLVPVKADSQMPFDAPKPASYPNKSITGGSVSTRVRDLVKKMTGMSLTKKAPVKKTTTKKPVKKTTTTTTTTAKPATKKPVKKTTTTTTAKPATKKPVKKTTITKKPVKK